MLYAAFVSSLHKIIGLEFGASFPSLRCPFSRLTSDASISTAAYFTQNVVSSYETHHAALQIQSASTSAPASDDTSTSAEGKECSNLIVLLSELYNFQVISSVLVFDIIRDLLSRNLTEFGVELLLKIVRSGFSKDECVDPD